MLTTVLTTRNDDYGGNLLGRLQAFIDSIDQYAGRYEWDTEIVLVEWNPPEGRPFLEEAVRPPVNIPLRIFRVPLELHLTFPNSDKVKIYNHLGRNVGLRRARGDWILSTTQDVIMSSDLARFLALENLSPSCYYRATRFDSTFRELPEGGVDEWVAHLSSSIEGVREFRPEQLLHTRGCGDFLLLTRNLWHAFKGSPEWGVHAIYIDGIIIFSAHVSGYSQVALDTSRCIYHVKHGGGAEKRKGDFPALDYKRDYKRLTHQMVRRTRTLDVNDDDWGLADCTERKVGEFTWLLEGDTEKQRGVEIPR